MEPANTSPSPETPGFKIDLGAIYSRALAILKPKVAFFIQATALAIVTIVVVWLAWWVSSKIIGWIFGIGTVIALIKVGFLVKLFLLAIAQVAYILIFAGLLAVFLPVVRGGAGNLEELQSFFKNLAKDKPLVTQLLIYAGIFAAIGFAGSLLNWLTYMTLSYKMASPLVGFFNLIFFLATLAFYILATFALPLILDKKMQAVPAIKLSYETVLRDPGMIIIFLLVNGIVGGIGVAVFGIGIVVTLPFAAIAFLCVYEGIFSGGMPAAPALPEAAPEAPAAPEPPAEQPPTE